MDSLIPVISKIQDVFATIGGREDEIQLPQIAVVGGQSTGKSSVIEGIVGRDFLPRGTGIVTRRPLLLHLIHTPVIDSKRDNIDENGDWVIFGHCKEKVFTDFEKVREEIQKETDRVTGKNKGISDIPIILEMYSANVVNLSLIDLPGITKVPVGDQPDDIEDQIHEIIIKYIKNPNCIILAVATANQDFATSESLKLAREVDKEGDRTLCVLTKLDLMDKGTDAMAVLTGEVFNVKHGIIGVVNRSQDDINKNETIEKCLKDEATFLNKKYPSLAEKNGIKFLAKKLNQLLMQHIRDCLPDLKLRVNKMIAQNKFVLSSCGEPVVNKNKALLDIITKFSSAYNSVIDGSSKGLVTEELIGGARIVYIFHHLFHGALDKIEPSGGLNPIQILTAIHNASGPRTPLFVPQSCFEDILRQQIQIMNDPCLKCVDVIHEELKRIVMHCGPKNLPEMQRFPKIGARINDIVTNLLSSRIHPTKEFVKNLVNIQLAFINTKHPEFDEKDDVEETPPKKSCVIPRVKDAKKNKNDWLDMNSEDIDKAVKKYRFHNLTDRENLEADRVEKLVHRYFVITRKAVQDMVPKAIMEFLVNYVRNNLQDELLEALSDPKDIDELLVENEDMAERREAAAEMLQALKKANNVINEVHGTHLW